MLLDARSYMVQQKNIRAWIDNREVFDYKIEVGMIALTTGMHIILVSYYIGKEIGFSEEIKSKMARDGKFYKIDKIIGFDGKVVDLNNMDNIE